MNISKLIEILQDTQARYGDIPVNAAHSKENPFDYCVVRVLDDRNGDEPFVQCLVMGHNQGSLLARPGAPMTATEARQRRAGEPIVI